MPAALSTVLRNKVPCCTPSCKKQSELILVGSEAQRTCRSCGGRFHPECAMEVLGSESWDDCGCRHRQSWADPVLVSPAATAEMSEGESDATADRNAGEAEHLDSLLKDCPRQYLRASRLARAWLAGMDPKCRRTKPPPNADPEEAGAWLEGRCARRRGRRNARQARYMENKRRAAEGPADSRARPAGEPPKCHSHTGQGSSYKPTPHRSPNLAAVNSQRPCSPAGRCC